MKKEMISFLMPAYNEELALPKVIKSLPLSELNQAGFAYEIVVVNNNSTDNTKKVAESLGARCVDETKKGYGSAYQKGFKSVKGDIIVTGDADGTCFIDVTKLIKILVEKELLFLSADRFSTLKKDVICFKNRVGNILITYLFNILFNLSLNDSCSGMWVFRTKILKELHLKESGMSMSQEIKIAAFRKLGKKAMEIPIDFTNDRIGIAKLQPWRDGIKTIIFLAKKRIFSKI